jgi:hypothetical protein
VDSRLKCNTGRSISEGFEGSQESEAFAGGVVVAKEASLKIVRRQSGQVGFAGEVTTESADGILDAAFLPGFVRIAEEGRQAELLSELVMSSELGAVVEGEGEAQGRGQRGEPVQEVFDHGLGGLVGLAGKAEETGGALMSYEHGLAIFSEEHEIGFPVAGEGAIVGLRGTMVNRDAVREEVDGAAAAAAQATAPRLVAGQETMPVILLSGAVVDKAIDGLVADQHRAFQMTETAGDLLGGPALFQVETDLSAELG